MFQFIQKSVFWPQYIYPKLSPFDGYSWCPLGTLSHLGMKQLCFIFLYIGVFEGMELHVVEK